MFEYKNVTDIPTVTLINTVNEIFKDYIVPVRWDINSFEKDSKEFSISLEDSFIVYENQKPIGVSIISCRKDLGRIDSFGVKEEYRGKGIASEMLYKTIEILKWKGVKKIVLEVASMEERAIKFYEKHGFKIKRILESFHTDVPDNIPPKNTYTIEDPNWLKESSFLAKTNLKRITNWQRHPQTLYLSDQRYKIEKIKSWDYVDGYVVWGINDDNTYIVDAAPIDDVSKYDELILDIKNKLSFYKNKIIVVAVPEDDPLNEALKNNNFQVFLQQKEMQMKFH
ncbi:GNAT family N-acetyltransferase [Oceanotoga sp. DSM 15011]|uniref:GNAT family N-acetyltransferase n=1 Tax=Oceanotoga sp. DSM 15011 TaxID=2984951 RepID=UPI0021F49B41|nr:GNAT family N-acetyltransferase [Oceanotoga sp. DSM 15011]UYP00706.1 GNAT family N-acetyltransferase [Oceanotoga sp. DSM 15011]